MYRCPGILNPEIFAQCLALVQSAGLLMNCKNNVSSYQSRIQTTSDDFQIGESLAGFCLVSAADNVMYLIEPNNSNRLGFQF